MSAAPGPRSAPLIGLAQQLADRYAGDLPRLRGELHAVRAEVQRIAIAVEERDAGAAITRDLEAALRSAGLDALVSDRVDGAALVARLDHLAGLIALFELTGAA